MVTSLHVCCGSHSERSEAAPEISSNPDQGVLMSAYDDVSTVSDLRHVLKTHPRIENRPSRRPTLTFGSQLVAFLGYRTLPL